jgi:uncharacterized protein YdiU (UPF0061 family)
MFTPESSGLDLRFDNKYIRELPGDPDTTPNRRQVYGACYSYVTPLAAPSPRLIAFSPDLATELGLSPEACRSAAFADVFSGNRLLAGMSPYATCYGGHQFGQWAGQLGDGRAINLGEAITGTKRRLTLQLKGAGPTPYSRSADGLAVLRSSVREFLCSEAMHALGIPTTRALSLVSTGRTVIRDMFYDGRPQAEPGAVVCRVAPSFTRFGNFELFAARGDIETLKQLVDYTLGDSFPELGSPCPDAYVAWFDEVCRRTARLIVEWQRVGFVHGVMNTDNMSILGLTIDYGPYGWLDDYDPNWTPNTTDAHTRRYRYANQPQIAYWNLVKLANAIYPLIGSEQALQDALNTYTLTYNAEWPDMMARKLGLPKYHPDLDDRLISELLTILAAVETDMTLFYRRLALIDTRMVDSCNESMISPLIEAYYNPDHVTDDEKTTLSQWLRRYLDRLKITNEPNSIRTNRMNSTNPLYIPRNYITQEAIEKAEKGDYATVEQLLSVFKTPYCEQPGLEKLAAKRPDWARNRAGCSTLSCSS